MDYYKSFDLNFSNEGKSFDISFEKKKIIKKKIIKKKIIKKEENITLLEKNNDNYKDDDNDEDISIPLYINIEGIDYVSFEDSDSVYEKELLIYIGRCSENLQNIHFTEKGLKIHSQKLKNLKLT